MTHAHLMPREDALVATNAVVCGDVSLGACASIWYGCVVRGDCDRVTIGEYTNVQDLSVIHSDTGVPNDIGAHVTIGHQAMVHGRRIGDRVLIGIGAIILGGAEIGDECIIAAGAVVKEGAQIPSRSLVAGVPGKVIRQITDDDISDFVHHAEHYWELACSHRPPAES
ncbi:MAG: gamma carbonic anhydrase family protein [Planctomycetota bacterium]|nr:gamma carbonic anhydrase family protein [Planctomycetota bacterium]